MDNYSEKRAILRHDLLRRQDYEQAGWEITDDNPNHDLVVYGKPLIKHQAEQIKKQATSLFNSITRSITDGIKRRVIWKR